MNRISTSAIHHRLVCLLLCGVAVLILQATALAQTILPNTDSVPQQDAVQCPPILDLMCIMGPDGGCAQIPCPFNQPTPSPKPLPVVQMLTTAPSPGQILISEFRLRGPGGPNDEFVELYNNSEAPITVSTSDGSAGWALVASDGVIRFIVPVGTLIPKRGHYLGVNGLGYSLSEYSGSPSSGDTTYLTDIPDGSGLALFNTSNPVNFTLAHRLDAAGYSSAPALYREGAGFTPYGAEMFANLEYSFYRDLSSGLPKDTDDNVADFMGVDPNFYNTSQGQHLGAPGPENLSSPVIYDNGALQFSLIDPAVSNSSAPNRERDTTPDPANNSTYGTLTIRRKITNTSTNNITTLRFRVVDITTFPAPDTSMADIRVRSSWVDSYVTLSDGSIVTAKGTYLSTPPSQIHGGGYNSLLYTSGVSPYTPLYPGQSINVQFLLGVQQTGTFRFFITVEVKYNEQPQCTETNKCIS